MNRFQEPKLYGAVSVGERGQIVIPAEVRKLYGIKPGDKVVVFSKPGEPIALIPAEQFSRFLDQAAAMMERMKKRTEA